MFKTDLISSCILLLNIFPSLLNDAGKFVLTVPLSGQTVKLLSTFDNIGTRLQKILDTLDLCILNLTVKSPLISPNLVFINTKSK